MSAVSHRILALCSLVLAVGCEGSTINEVKSFGPNQAFVTSADVRLVNKTKPTYAVGGRVTPDHIICSEPSPDVAKAIAESFNLGGSFGGGLPSGVSPEAAAAISLARAEGMAQLTQRLATIQLLRDGLYRACEAYANGAISDTTYAVLISGYDDTMVTMLLGELAAGNFSGRLAAIGTGAGGSASAQLNQATRRLIEASGLLANAARREPEPPAEGGTSSETQEARRSSERSRDSALRAAADSMAQAAQIIAAESTGFRQNPQIAETLGTMQRKFIENINMDAMVVACINALDQGRIEGDISGSLTDLEAALVALKGDSKNAAKQANLMTARRSFNKLVGDSLRSPLAAHCMTGVIPEIVNHGTMILDHILGESLEKKSTDHVAEILGADAKAVFDVLEVVEKRKIDLAALPTERAALKTKIETATAATKSARAEAERQRNVAEDDERNAMKLADAVFDAELAAERAEAKRDALKAAYDAAKARAADAAKRAKEAQDASAAQPNDANLKDKAEREQEIANQRTEELDAAKAAFDGASGEADRLRVAADAAARAAKDARDKADASREEWRKLDRRANEKQADLDGLTAQL